MPIVWRIAQKSFAKLDGIGGFYASGRWHTKGKRIIYTAESESLAILETLVHFDRSNPPPELVILTIEIPDKQITMMDVTRFGSKNIDSFVKTQAYGDNWHQKNQSLCICVPSILARTECNYILNPEHPEFHQIKKISQADLHLDKRLL